MSMKKLCSELLVLPGQQHAETSCREVASVARQRHCREHHCTGAPHECRPRPRYLAWYLPAGCRCRGPDASTRDNFLCHARVNTIPALALGKRVLSPLSVI